MRGSRLLKTSLARVLQLTGTSPLEGRWGEACAVFAFHRISDPADEAMFTSSTESMPRNLFEEFAAFIRQCYNPIDYLHFEEHMLSGEPFAERSCLITFDDGWLDNYTNAWPVLRKHQLPALIFLPTSFIGSTRRFWQDELYAAFRALREKRMNGPFFFEAHALADVVYDLLEDKADRAWYYTREAVERLKRMEHEFSLKSLEAVLRYAYDIAGPPAAPRAFLNNEEVRRMAADGVYFGSHSVSHRILPRLDDEELYEEIDRSREEIAAITDYRTTAFSYPNGDFDARVAGHVQRAGYTTGFTIEYGTAPSSGPRFALRRIDMTPEMISHTSGRFSSAQFALETMPGMLTLKRRRQHALRKDTAKVQRRIRLMFLIDEMQGEAGTEKQIVNLVRRLDPEKFEIHLACFVVSNWLRSLKLPCRIYDLNAPSFWRPSAHLNILRFAGFLRREKIDIIQTFFPAAHVVGVTAAFLARVPRIISSRRNFGHALTTTQKLTMMFINRLTHRILANSFSVKQRTIELESVRARHVDIIYNGVDTFGAATKDPDRRLTKADLGFGDEQQLVGVVANLRPVKGVKYFIEAAAIVNKTHPQARFVIFGFGDLINDLRKLTNDLGLTDKVHFMGRTPSVAEYLPLLDIAVLSSLSEGFSNSILEYMAAGLPVVATAVGSNWETVDHGATGYLAHPQDPANIAEQIVELLNNPGQRKRMGIEGKRRVLASFSMERMVARYDEYYRYTLSTPYRQRHFQV